MKAAARGVWRSAHVLQCRPGIRSWIAATGRAFASGASAPRAVPSVTAFACSAAGAGVLWAAADTKPALAEEDKGNRDGKDGSIRGDIVKDAVTEAYENRIRAFSAPEKVFALFASKVHDGEAHMTPHDFLRALHPKRAGAAKSSPRQRAAAKRLFQLVDLNGDGLISFHEYLFFMTMLSLPPSRFKVAFDMFDVDGSGALDQQEFADMMEVLKAKSIIGGASRADVVSTSNKVKGAKAKRAEKDKVKYPVLFGPRGTRALTSSRFASYLEQLQQDLVTLEFESFAPEAQTDSISAADFAASLVSHVYPKQYRDYMKRIALIENTERVSYADFVAFERMLSHLDDIALAIDTFSAAKGGFGKEHLLHAAKVVAGVKLDPKLVDVIYLVFDSDKSGTLENDEFLSVMQLRRFRGASRRRSIDVSAFLGCCRTCFADNLILA